MDPLDAILDDPLPESAQPFAPFPALSASCSLPLPTRIAFVGNYLPRQCGIATFTTDLCAALASEFGGHRLFAIPVNDPDSAYDYPSQVRIELDQEDETSYERAAEFLNFNGNDLVCVQHEYGIYGGVVGRYILTLLSKLKMPVVTTLHTVLRDPNPDQRIVLEEIARLSDRLVVMSEQAAQFLRDIYQFQLARSTSFRTASPTSSLWIPISSKTASARRESPSCSRSVLSPNKSRT